MWIFPEKPDSASIMPLAEPSGVALGWAALGLPETGWVLVVDEDQCQLCPDEVDRPCHYECKVHQAACSFCSERILAGALPLCVKACPHGAIWIGNLERNNVTNGLRLTRLSELLKRRRFAVAEPDHRTLVLQT